MIIKKHIIYFIILVPLLGVNLKGQAKVRNKTILRAL